MIMASTIKRKELIRKFKSFGYSGPFSGGKHHFMIISLVKEILRQAGITIDEWNRA